MKIIQKGSKGIAVKNWQGFLNDQNNSDYKVGKVDGNFGGRTENATRNFQEDNGLVVDGIVGKNTYKKAEEYGFRLPTQIKKYTRTVNEIIVHITAAGNSSVAEIRRGHLARGFSDIGYHFLILEDGNIYEGRDLNVMGAHCQAQGKNVATVGISYDSRGSDTESAAPYGKYANEDQQASLEKLTAWLIQLYDLTIYDVSGHNDYDKGKACPCFKVKKSETFLNRVKALLENGPVSLNIIPRN